MELITNPSAYSREFSLLDDPKIIGYFSVDDEGSYYPSTEKLAYLHWNNFASKHIKLDLTKGENDSIKRTEKNEDSFFYYLAEHPDIVHEFAATSLAEAGFICRRKTLTKIGKLPYEERDSNKFNAYLYQGNIYINNLEDEKVDDPRWYRCSRWGHKFKQYLLSENPFEPPVTNKPVMESENFKCVFKTTLNQHRMLYGAKIDAVIMDEDDNKTVVPDLKNATEEEIINDLKERKFVDLKTSMKTHMSLTFKRYKTKDIWLQNNFSRIDSVVIGFRNYDGIVNDVKRFKMNDLKDYGQNYWKPHVCLNFIDEFLTYVKLCFNKEIMKLPNYTPDIDLKTLEPIELFFSRKASSNVVLTTNFPDKNRTYLHPWFKEGVTIEK